MKRYFLHLSYKGTNFFGWQIQPEHRSIQEVLEEALSKLHSNKEVGVTGCGRTDTGVHASNYYAHFDSELEWNVDDLKHKLNGMVGPDIAILSVIPVQLEAHARFDAESRTYHYFIHREKDPFLQEISWFHKPDLDITKMNEACLILQDYEDFECFSKVQTEVNHFLCDIQNALWVESDRGYIFSITANRFLRNMVRAIVGTMVEIGLGKLEPEDMKRIIESKNRSEAGQSAPAQGLFLADIVYPYITQSKG